MDNRPIYNAQHEAKPVSGYGHQHATDFTLPDTASTAAVLRNTYMLLGLTLGFSALVAWFSLDASPLNPFLTIGIYIGLLFGTAALRNSGMGIAMVFALTGFLGYTLGPLVGMYLAAGMANVVANALTLTAVTFLGLSAYVLTTRKDLSFMSGFITAGAIVLLVAMLIGLFMNSIGFHLMLSAGFALFAASLILYQTSEIIHGGERNYIMATVTLYVSIYNLFVSLLSLLGASED